MTIAKITYERETCPRCCGCGEYSYNQIDGTRCYGCGGKGTRLSRRGKSAQAKVRAFIREHWAKRAADLVPGDRVKLNASDSVRTVVSADLDRRENHGGTIWHDEHDDTDVVLPSFTIKTQKTSLGCALDTVIEVRPSSPDDWERIAAYARRFKGATIHEVAEAAPTPLPRCYICEAPVSFERQGDVCDRCARTADPRDPDDDPARNEDGWDTGRGQ